MPKGRLAPSPTGAQHPGNARTFLVAWLAARSSRSPLVCRIEDIDSPRVKLWALTQALDDLAWLGLDWDEGPPRPGVRAAMEAGDEPGVPFVQSQRLARYRDVLAELKSRELIYPCTCSRSEASQAASAPHAGHEPAVYPGTCAGRFAGEAASLPEGTYCWRFRMAGFREPIGWQDAIAGLQVASLPGTLGDFVIAKADGTPSYQLAVVVDDHDMGIEQVVRGDDLIPSTFRQLALYQTLGWQAPGFAHVPLVKGPDGLRLAKRHGDSRLSILREAGVDPRRVIGWLARSLGLAEEASPITPGELIETFAWEKIAKDPVMFPREVWEGWLR
ncbi:MAG: tRNA glutamyl-Q(34) synthetase GluQRS [Planctomyces sp.]|nr:tRNA glutamyl-Q(34) synthetase GluQRS [Planctomyces sp.]